MLLALHPRPPFEVSVGPHTEYEDRSRQKVLRQLPPMGLCPSAHRGRFKSTRVTLLPHPWIVPAWPPNPSAPWPHRHRRHIALLGQADFRHVQTPIPIPSWIGVLSSTCVFTSFSIVPSRAPPPLPYFALIPLCIKLQSLGITLLLLHIRSGQPSSW